MKRLTSIILIALFCITGCTSLENAPIGSNGTFFKIYGLGGTANSLNIAKDVQINERGEFVLAGYSDDMIKSIIYVLDQNGNITKEKTYDSVEVNSIRVIENGYLLTGDKYEAGDYTSITIMELDNELNVKNEPSGISEFNSSDGDDYHGWSVYDDGSGYIVLGTQETSIGDQIILAKMNSQFDSLEWHKVYVPNPFDNEPGRGLHLTENNGNEAYLFGFTSSTLVDERDQKWYAIASVESNAEPLANYEGSLSSNLYSMKEVASLGDGMFGIIGTTNENGDTDIYFSNANNQVLGNRKVYTETTDNGITEPNSQNDEGLSISGTSDGGFIILGARETNPGRDDIGNGGLDFLLMRTDPNGAVLWQQVIGSEEEEFDGVVRQAPDGGYLIFGSVRYRGLSNFVVIKTDQNGEVK